MPIRTLSHLCKKHRSCVSTLGLCKHTMYGCAGFSQVDLLLFCYLLPKNDNTHFTKDRCTADTLANTNLASDSRESCKHPVGRNLPMFSLPANLACTSHSRPLSFLHKCYVLACSQSHWLATLRCRSVHCIWGPAGHTAPLFRHC